MTNDPHQFTLDAWEANAEVWDARMGDEGNDFFKTRRVPTCLSLVLSQGSTARRGSRMAGLC